MYRTWGGKANNELCLICTEHGAERPIVNCVLYVQNMGWRGKEWTVSDMYRTWGGKANNELCLKCTEHGVERQTVNGV